MSGEIARRRPIGAEVTPGGVHFRVWAPQRRHVAVEIEDERRGPRAVELAAEGSGYFSGLAAEVGDGSIYRYRLDRGDCFPDPASRFQPAGPHGPSRVVDPGRFSWTDQAWRGVEASGQVIYELHVGTFTCAGTWAAATAELDELARLGISVIELMPVADFPGRFGWGYDGVNLFAPTRLYGQPDDFRRFIDRAHALGLGVILDVVYNHLGPDGNYLRQFAPDYFTDRYATDWGDAINFDGPESAPVREYFLTNARYWIEEYHLDGLRLDATQCIFDASPINIMRELGQVVRQAAGGRGTLLVGENEPQQTRLVRPISTGGYGLDALWNDDFHHSAMVALTDRHEAYYSDHSGSPQELISAAKWGYLLQGQRYRWQNKRRGTPTFGLPPSAFVTFIQNHDQVANSAQGLRCHLLTSPGRYRAVSALMILMPGTPMLFQGQEFAASTPFLYFADHKPDLARLVRDGRREFLSQFPSIATPAMQARLADPNDPTTFERSKLDRTDRDRHAEVYTMYRDLLQLRREDPVLRAPPARSVDGAVLGRDAFLLRYFDGEGDDRLLLVNLGIDLNLTAAPEPLLAPPAGSRWRIRWSSEEPSYGGGGTPPIETDQGWHLPGDAAVLLVAGPEEDNDGD